MLVKWAKDFGLYLKCKSKSLKSLKQEDDVIRFAVLKYRCGYNVENRLVENVSGCR